MTGWMLLIGLSLSDPQPEMAGDMGTKEKCESAAIAINRAAQKAEAKLFARCGEIEYLKVNEDGSISQSTKRR